jgi:hypothetical protein
MKYIICNESSVSDSDALCFVGKVIEAGKISMTAGKPQHCFVTRFTGSEGSGYDVVVYCILNKKSERFVVRNVKK